MALIKIAGIMRAGVFSPNRIGSDAAIFNIVAEQLRKRGCEVKLYNEEQFLAGAVAEDVVINMCREPRSIELLQQLEDDGKLVINSGYGIENCARERMTRILLGSNIPYPESIIVNTDEGIRDTLIRARMDRCWIKRADTQSLHKEDVSYVRTPAEAQEVLQEYFLRGIKRAVICRHLEGDLLKFYGVAGTPFFYWFFPYKSAATRDPRNGQPVAEDLPEFDHDALERICDRAADILDVRVYGGDAIVAADGSFKIIDFDDFPSFSPCRNEAAPFIAKCVMAEIKKHSQR